MLSLKTIGEQVRWGENVLTLADLGRMKVPSWDVENKTIVYRLYDSKIARLYGQVGRAVDHIPRGGFAGSSSVFFGTDIDTVETKCYSMGDDFCEFMAKPSKQV